MTNLTLYSFYRSSAAYRVRIALNAKGLDYKYVAVDLTASGQREASYAELNLMEQVPTLVTPNGRSLGQSMAIFLWLDKTYKNNPLFPSDADDFASMIQFCENINSGIHPIQNLAVRQKLQSSYQVDTTGQDKWCAHWIDVGFKSIEKYLARTAGQYCFGDSVTAADMFLIPQVVNAYRFKVNMSQFPTIDKIDKACMELEIFKKAQPSQQPDFKPA